MGFRGCAGCGHSCGGVVVNEGGNAPFLHDENTYLAKLVVGLEDHLAEWQLDEQVVVNLKDAGGEYWVKPEWHKLILEAYFQELSELGQEPVTWEEFLLDLQAAKLCNYAGIVFSHLKNNWPLTSWYQVNLDALVQG